VHGAAAVADGSLAGEREEVERPRRAVERGADDPFRNPHHGVRLIDVGAGRREQRARLGVVEQDARTTQQREGFIEDPGCEVIAEHGEDGTHDARS